MFLFVREKCTHNPEQPWYWRKGPRVNDEYTGHMADGDPLFSPPDGWEPPINYHDSAYLPRDDSR